jgi:chromosomal replication initiator protein
MGSLSPDIKLQIYNEFLRLIAPEEFFGNFNSLDIRVQDDSSVEILLPNAYYCNWYERHYKDKLFSAITSVFKKKCLISFKALSDYQSTLFPLQKDRSVSPPLLHKPSASIFSSRGSIIDTLNSRYIFDQFVIGPCNRLAHAWTLAVAENPGKAYNPLFIHGSVGLGKTHLLQAACHYLLNKHHDLTIYYLSCESFINAYIGAVKSGNYESFRQKYRLADVLIVDDIHFLGSGDKQASQEEFFHTFNALHNSQKQIILSSDSPPQDISTLENRLISRFKWGRIARIDPPSFETRVAILKQLADWYKKEIPDNVLHFLASNIDSNIRDLEGALKNVIGYSEVHNSPISLSSSKDALQDFLSSLHSFITIPYIQEFTGKYFNVSVADMNSKKRTKSVSIPRQIGIYLSRIFTNSSFEEIGMAFGGKDHATIIYSFEKIKQRITQDKQFKNTIDILISSIKSGG